MPRKKKTDEITSGEPGTEGVRDERNKAAQATAPKPVQARLDLGNEVVEFQEIEIEIAVSETEAHLLDAQATAALREKAKLEAELKELREAVKDKAAEVQERQNFASARAKESSEKKRLQKQRVKVVYHPSRATVHYLDPVTEQPVKPSEPMKPADMKRLADGGDGDSAGAPPDDDPPLDPPPEDRSLAARLVARE